jgi:hypothetical protein
MRYRKHRCLIYYMYQFTVCGPACMTYSPHGHTGTPPRVVGIGEKQFPTEPCAFLKLIAYMYK